jgi:hypothetical protein
VESVRTELADQVSAQRQEIDDLRGRLEARVQELVGRVERGRHPEPVAAP